MKLYKAISLEEGVGVQYVGFYVLKWRPEWGMPDLGFVEVDSDEIIENLDDIVGNKYFRDHVGQLFRKAEDRIE